ncbi:MAG: hypothetical protein F6K09_05630 [Merismopedia sp. SIO2A8]|nr:hypothetical protein [Symploca sp. SIO2B6]NET48199.1 hypothetical protein [Merismopedia sp. SIO2A8]
MTELLEQAIEQLKMLDAQCQDHIVALIIAELEEDAAWDHSFSQSQDLLANLAAEAMAEYHAGQTQELNPETL